ncbi:MAG TPA: alpha-L-fucosidase [Chitinophagaceae bacterium]|nr:alpha-L-fucosidase [Chitinophagaceae bacterium]
MRSLVLPFFLWSNVLLNAQVNLPLPTKAQLAWHDMEFYLFMHFGPNTFTDKEWGHGDERADIFNPTQLDCKQWCRIAKAAGAKAIIITAKHHDGFCLWPSKYSKHTVRESKWKNGQGDVLKELSQACKQYGLKFGVYISPWDRNHPKYGTPEYNDVFVNMMKEIFTNYGPIWELWWDGANGEGPNGKKQVYDWDRFKKTVKTLSPNTVVFSDVGPHVRWVGNEKGIAGKTNWNYLDTVGFTPGIGAPPVEILNSGNEKGKAWIPAECDVSIRPGWFYHANEDDKVKSPDVLFDLYLKSVGRGANLLLNVPPDRRGLIHGKDSISLIGFKKLRDESFAKNLLKGSTVITYNNFRKGLTKLITDGREGTFITTKVPKEPDSPPNLKMEFKSTTRINCLVLQEALMGGQKTKKMEIALVHGNTGIRDIQVTTVGRKRIITFPAVNVDKVLIYLKDSNGNSVINEVAAYLIDENLVEK